MTPTYAEAVATLTESLRASDDFGAPEVYCTRETASAILDALRQPPPVGWREDDLAWLRRLVERQAYSGHCGEENAEIRAREDNDDRLERIITALRQPATQQMDREAVARVISSNPAYLAEVRDEQQTWLADHLAQAIHALYRRTSK